MCYNIYVLDLLVYTISVWYMMFIKFSRATKSRKLISTPFKEQSVAKKPKMFVNIHIPCHD